MILQTQNFKLGTMLAIILTRIEDPDSEINEDVGSYIHATSDPSRQPVESQHPFTTKLKHEIPFIFLC